jgi:hypothetical protein
MPSLLETLRSTNPRLRFLLDSIAAGAGDPAVATPGHMAALLQELSTVGAALRARPLPAPGHDAELDRQLAQYRSQVERLRELLPSIHQQLLAERARLEAQRSRFQSAAAWARTSRQTL